MTTLTADTSMVLIGCMIFTMGFGLGLVMQIIVLVIQNSVAPELVGTATSTNNYFREIGASVGTALFGSIFTSRLADKVGEAMSQAPGGAAAGGASTDSLTPESVASLPGPIHDLVVNAYADALAPSFWYMVPVFLVAFVLAWFLPQLKLSDVAGMVARGEAVYGDDMGGAARGDSEPQGQQRLSTISVEEQSLSRTRGRDRHDPGSTRHRCAGD